MPTEEKDTEEEKEEEKETKTPTPAEAKNTEEEKGHMIPKSRLDEEIKRRKESENRLAAVEKEKASQLERQLEEQGEYKKLAEERATKIAEIQPVADQVDSMSQTLTEYLAAQIADIPEAMQDLVPAELPVQQQLNWLAKNKARLMKPNAPSLDAGKRGGEGKAVELNDEQRAAAKNMKVSEEDYAKNL